ncbi:MAG: hypothetical protein ACFB21_15985 [Opitutales bacterium]
MIVVPILLIWQGGPIWLSRLSFVAGYGSVFVTSQKLTPRELRRRFVGPASRAYRFCLTTVFVAALATLFVLLQLRLHVLLLAPISLAVAGVGFMARWEKSGKVKVVQPQALSEDSDNGE